MRYCVATIDTTNARFETWLVEGDNELFRKRIATCALVVLLITTVSCRSKTATTESPSITIAAASNLTDTFEELGPGFTSATGVRVVVSFGATADLAKQIEHGAPFDVFLAADAEHVEQLDSKGLLAPDSRKNYARGRLVMWLPASSKLAAQRIEDITGKEFERIAIAKPDVAPYGRAAEETLRALGIWDEIKTKVVYSQTVSQAKQYAATGNAEIAFIPLALVKPGEGRYIQVGAELHRPIDQAIGIVKESGKQDSARRFVEFLMSTEGQQLLAKHGYDPPTP
jgi:molybdate transport system substrate-binding protein